MMSCENKQAHQQAIERPLVKPVTVAPRNILLDTVITRQISLYPIDHPIALIYTLQVQTWEKPILWSIQLKDSSKVYGGFGAISDHHTWALQDTPMLIDRDSVISSTKRLFLVEMPQLHIQTIGLDDDRDWLKRHSRKAFRNEHAYSAFWEFYENKRMECITDPNPDPPGGGLYCFDPNVNALILIYSQ
jgi:hypothetical protein